MIRIDFRYQIWQFVLLVLLQVPLLYKFVMFDTAFGFFYVGFLIFFPFRVSSILKLTGGFLVGLLMDIFSSTPGMHAAACVAIMFVRDYWLVFVADDPEDEPNISVFTLGQITTIAYMLPLIFLHHLIIFTIEYGRWTGYLRVVNKIFWSGILTFFVIYLVNLIIAPRRRRG